MSRLSRKPMTRRLKASPRDQSTPLKNAAASPNPSRASRADAAPAKKNRETLEAFAKAPRTDG
jgi:hypothetical protein